MCCLRRLGLVLLLAAGASGCWRKVVQISTGGDHSCGLRWDDVIVCWGVNEFGQSVAPFGRFKQVSAGDQHSCAIRKDGTVACWGRNTEGQSSAPGGTFTLVSAAQSHTCGLRTDGKVTCWGGNGFGQSKVPAGEYVDVAAGPGHTCAVTIGGEVRCWGANEALQCNPPPGTFRKVTVGKEHSCALYADGKVTCWGAWFAPKDEDSAKEGAKKVEPPSFHKALSPEGTFTSLSSDSHYASCALGSDQLLVCWSSQRERQSGAVPGLFRAFSGGSGSGCGVHSDGHMECWGPLVGKQGYHPRTAFWPFRDRCSSWEQNSGFCGNEDD